MGRARRVVIGSAWTYANSDIHLGHISAYISGDVLARYHRAAGDEVAFVSGTDCHGTPTTERAIREKTTPEAIVSRYHQQYEKVFQKLGFSYDCYTLTATPYHHEKVKEMFLQLDKNGFLYPKTELASYCATCKKFIYDREVEVICPKCHTVSKGDQCDNCAYVFQSEDLLKGKCRICGKQTEIRENTNLYFALSKLEPELKKHFEKCKKFWRKNTVNETEKFLREGLIDRAVTRDLNWGVDVPFSGFDDKKIYVWVDAVWGYVSATMLLSDEKAQESSKKVPLWEDFWKDHQDGSNLMYLCHGKDNIVFHTIIFPALLLACKQNYFLPNVCVSTEFLNINSEKISKSKGNGWPMLDMLQKFDPDSLRMFTILNGPEKKDANFTFADYHAMHNGDLVNKYGNFVNRTLNYKGLDGFMPAGKIDAEVKAEVEKTYAKVSQLIEKISFRDAVNTVFELVDFANKFYDTRQPWVLFKNEDKTEFNNVIATCAFIIANLANLFEPFMPFSSAKIKKYLQLDSGHKWEVQEFWGGKSLGRFEPLFSRLTESDVM